MPKKLFIASAMMLTAGALCAVADNLVILHTNDTHSAIDPVGNTGGILQRKAIIDSVKNTEKNVILVDAGDIVQGSLYFKLFRGEVEFPLFDDMGYDIRILGNHEFDNGMEELQKYYKKIKGTPISANYDFSGTLLDGIFKPYTVKKIGGKKIGFVGLNVDPSSLISDNNIQVKFLPIIEQANKYAKQLKEKEKVDLVVAVTHIGYEDEGVGPTDVDLAKASKDIDIIIGGHSHTVVPPKEMAKEGDFECIIKNADGKPVLVTQTGKYGRNLGYIKIDLDKLKKAGYDGDDFEYRLIPVTNRFPESALDKKLQARIAPYKHVIDSINAHYVAYSSNDMGNNGIEMSNMTADFAKWYGDLVADSIGGINGKRKIDLSIMNVGGIRKDWPKGYISEGNILDTYPFSNHYVVLDLSGADVLETLRIAGGKNIKDAISDEIRVVMDGKEMKGAYINGEPIDPNARYLVGTIDYLANGKDLLTPLKNGNVVWTDPNEVVAPIMRYIVSFGEKGLPISPDPTPRFQQEVKF